MAYSITYIQTPMNDPNNPCINIFTVSLERIGFKNNIFYSHFIDIDPDQEYIFSIDQSLSSTGVCIASLDFSFVIVFTIIIGSRDIFVRNKYLEVLFEFLQSLLENKHLKFITLEAVPPSKCNRTRIKLDPLKGAIEQGLEAIPAIYNLNKDYKFSIFPNTWKSTVYDKKDKRQGAFNNKSEIARDIVKIYPALESYLKELSKNTEHDYDGFDAFGRLIHTRLKCFTPDWNLVNKSGKYQLGKFYALFAYLTDKEAVDEKKLMGPLAPWISYGNLDIRVWNEDASIFNNLIMAINTNKVICMECKSVKLLLAFLIEFDISYDKNKILYVIVGKPTHNQFNQGQLERLKKEKFYIKTYYK